MILDQVEVEVPIAIAIDQGRAERTHYHVLRLGRADGLAALTALGLIGLMLYQR